MFLNLATAGSIANALCPNCIVVFETLFSVEIEVQFRGDVSMRNMIKNRIRQNETLKQANSSQNNPKHYQSGTTGNVTKKIHEFRWWVRI